MHASAGATHRLFFALWPDDEVRRAITARATEFAGACAPGGRPVAPQRYHLTLQFLGSFAALPEAVVEGAIAAGDNVHAPELTLLLDRIGSFERNRVWWLGCDPSPGLLHLRGELGRALAAAGLRTDGKPFRRRQKFHSWQLLRSTIRVPLVSFEDVTVEGLGGTYI